MSETKELKFENGSRISWNPSSAPPTGVGEMIIDGEPEYSEEEEFLPPAKMDFHVTDEESAAWVVAKILNCDDEEKRIRANMKRELDEVARRRSFFTNRYLSELKAYADEVLSNDPRKKSVRVASGSLGYRRKGDGIAVEDESTLIEWAEENCKAAIKKSLLKTPVNEYFKITGDIPPGCAYQVEVEEFKISAPPKMKGENDGTIC